MEEDAEAEPVKRLTSYECATDGVTELEQGRVPANWWLDLERIPETIASLDPQDDASVAVLSVP